MKTVRELLASGAAPFHLPTLDPEALIEIVEDPDFYYWYRYTDPETGDTDEVRGKSYWSKETLVGRCGVSETWIS